MPSSQRRSLQLFRFQTVIIVGSLAALIAFSPGYLQAQSPLTIQPSTGNVGIGTTNPESSLEVAGHSPDVLPVLNVTEYGAENGGVASFTGRAARGTETNPTALMANDRLVSFRAHGFTGSGFSLGGNASIEIDAAEDWSDTNRGTYMLFETTPNGASSRLERMRITDSGNIGIGTTTPTSLLHVNGTFTATSKNFQIDHPLDPAKKFLVHSALEGPEVAVYYRGEAQLVNGEVEITLPSYFEALTRKEQRTVQLTPIKGWSPLYVSDDVLDGRFTVRSAGATPAQRFCWEVKAVRADIAPLVVEKEKIAEQVSLTTSHSLDR